MSDSSALFNFALGNFIALFLSLLFSAISLYLSAALLKLKGNNFSKAVYSTISLVAASLLLGLILPFASLISLLIALAVYLYCIKSIYATDWQNSFFLWILSIIVASAISIILGLVL